MELHTTSKTCKKRTLKPPEHPSFQAKTEDICPVLLAKSKAKATNRLAVLTATALQDIAKILGLTGTHGHGSVDLEVTRLRLFVVLPLGGKEKGSFFFFGGGRVAWEGMVVFACFFGNPGM